MKQRCVIAGLLLVVPLIMASIVFGAAVDYFLKIDGIPGESADAKHKDEVQLLTWSWGETQATAARSAIGAGGAGKVQFMDFTITMAQNKASIGLFKACANGYHIKNAILTARKAGKSQQDYYKITFSGIIVKSYQQSGNSTSSALPIDIISFNYSAAELEYRIQNPDGSLGTSFKAGYDIKASPKGL